MQDATPPPPADTPADPPPPAPSSDEQARAYESVHHRLLVARLLILMVVLALYSFSGASVDLATGLASYFGERWWWTNAAYLLISFLGYSALLFPLNWYSEHYIEHRYGLSRQDFNGWVKDHFKGLAIEAPLIVFFFSIIYALLHASPQSWWMWTALFYVFFVVLLSTVWPVWIMPLFHTFERLEPSPLTEAVEQFARRSGIEVLGVYKWGLEAKTSTANAALTGIGKTRRIILADTMLNHYSPAEIIAVLAHEVAHFKHGDLWRLMLMGSTSAVAGFYVAHRMLHAWVGRLPGVDGVADIGGFPLFVFALFLFTLLVMPLSNAYSRRREYAADAYAVRATGSATDLTSALNKLAAQNLANKEPAPWIEFLLHSHPSIARRTAAVQRVAGTQQPTGH